MGLKMLMEWERDKTWNIEGSDNKGLERKSNIPNLRRLKTEQSVSEQNKFANIA